MNIIPRQKIEAAVLRCLAMGSDLDEAIEAVAQSLHLPVETVLECIEGVAA